ncbi:MAG: NUDIX domain-containing protein [Nanoarchaeota archaeon]
MKMSRTSAGILMYRKRNGQLEFFLVHPGGPFWKDKDDGAWGIPKGEIDDPDEGLFDVAKREIMEETGIKPPEAEGGYFHLGDVTLKSGKVVHAWAFEGDWLGLLMCSSYVDIEWPPKSGKTIKIPEVDKAGFFGLEKARKKINPGQFKLIERLVEKLEEK